jgi:DNA modification methylase
LIVEVRGGFVVKCDLWKHQFDSYLWQLGKGFALAVCDPPYGNIVDSDYDKITDSDLCNQLVWLMEELAQLGLPGSHVWIWGGIGRPGERAFYRSMLRIEEDKKWQMAEQITWNKKRAYGTNWRSLMNREECFRYVLGDIKKPRVYNVQYTDIDRGYAGFNKKHPAKSKFRRETMIWSHASDMGQNKPHQCHKPGPLAISQIGATTNPGDLVLDLFSGSGQVSLSAREMDRKFVAFEKNDLEFDKLVARLSD